MYPYTCAWDAYQKREEPSLHPIVRAYRLGFLPHCINFIIDPPLSASSKDNQRKALVAGIDKYVIRLLDSSHFEGDEDIRLSKIQDYLIGHAQRMMKMLERVEKRDEFVDWLGHRKLVEDYSGITLAEKMERDRLVLQERNVNENVAANSSL